VRKKIENPAFISSKCSCKSLSILRHNHNKTILVTKNKSFVESEISVMAEVSNNKYCVENYGSGQIKMGDLPHYIAI